MRTSPSERYYRSKFSGGRRALGRILDYAALRAILLLSFFLLFRAGIRETRLAWFLAALALLAASLLIRIIRETLYARFRRKEKKRLFRMLLSERLMLLPTNEFLRLCDSLLEAGRIPCPLQCAEPAGADEILRFVRAAGDRPISVFSTSGYTKDAEAFSARSDIDVQLMPAVRLLEAASASRVCPGEEDMEQRIADLLAAAKERRKTAAKAPFSDVRSGKYFLAAVFLTGASFLTGYALYYRLLAGLCLTLAVFSKVFTTRFHASQQHGVL